MSSYYWSGYGNYDTSSATSYGYSWCPHAQNYANCYKQDCDTCPLKLKTKLEARRADEEDIE